MNPVAQYTLKALIVAAGIALAIMGHLTMPLAGLLSSGLLALGVTNGASIIAQAGSLGTQLPPPPPAAKPSAPATALAATAIAFAAVIGCAFVFGACSGSNASSLETMSARDVKAFCAAVNAAQSSLDGGTGHE